MYILTLSVFCLYTHLYCFVVILFCFLFCSCFVVLSIFIFVCTTVGLLPPDESPIAVVILVVVVVVVVVNHWNYLKEFLKSGRKRLTHNVQCPPAISFRRNAR